jgi:hypothetical protein
MAILGGGLAPAVVAAQTAAASPAPETDYAVFRKTADAFQLVSAFNAVVIQQFDDEALKDLTPAQRTVFRSALTHELDARHEAIVDAMMRQSFPLFSHDEVVRLAHIASTPAAARIGTALFRASQGDDTATNALENDPDLQALSPSDGDLIVRYFSTVPDAVAATKPIIISAAQAAFEAADAAAKST